MSKKLPDYYNRHKAKSPDETLLFIASRGLQSAELNEMQSISDERITRLMNTFLVDGAIQSGGACVINQGTGETTLAAAEIYIRGRIRDVPEKQFIIPVTGEVFVGVWLAETIVTAIDDPTLRDPAEGSRNYDEAGAARLRVTAQWGLSTENQNGNFYRVYDIENGVLKIRSAPPDMSGMNNALARYDRDNNGGNYIINGMGVSFIKHENEKISYSIQEGKAHVYGFEIEFPTALRVEYPFDPDLQTILSEPHQYQAGSNGKMRVDVDRPPINNIIKVDITKEKTTTIIHGSYSGVVDALPDNSIIEVLEVKQNSTVYQSTRDFIFKGGNLDWSPSGQEPAPGSSYQVKYKFITQAEIEAQDETGFTVSGAVAGSLVLVDYQWRLPRIDTLSLDREGKVHRIKGLPDRINPKPANVPLGQLELAQLNHRWHSKNPTKIISTAVAAVSMSTLQAMRQDIMSLYDLVAIERLKTDAVASAPAATRGVFVDPFLDDDLRDLGQSQTAAIVDGELILPIRADIKPLDSTNRPITLPYEREVIIDQTAQTGHMKINPYAAFGGVPATVTLSPPTDVWTVTETVNLADETRIIGTGLRTREVSDIIERQTKPPRPAEFLRPIEIRFEIHGFIDGEELRAVNFDGVNIAVTSI